MDRFLTVRGWEAFWEATAQTVASRGARLIAILLIYIIGRNVIYRLIDASLVRIMARHRSRDMPAERENRLRTLQGLVKSVVGYVLLFVVIVMVLQAVTVDVTGLITTAGVGGLAIGFGAQKLVKDIISGFFIIIEDQFAVGDYVAIGLAAGTVEELGMRTTRIRDDMGRLWILSNGDISSVINHSRAPVEAWIEIGIGPAADVDRAEAVINEAGAAMLKTEERLLLAAPRSLGVSAYDAAKTTLRVAVVAEPRALSVEQMRVREALRGKLLEAGIPVA